MFDINQSSFDKDNLLGKNDDRMSTCSRCSTSVSQSRSNYVEPVCPHCNCGNSMKLSSRRSFSRPNLPQHNSSSHTLPPKPKMMGTANRHPRTNRFRNASSVDWNNLNEKIEDWFEVAKTPEQKIVYKFLKEIKDEKYHDDQSCVTSMADTYEEVDNNVQSLEDILDNLKKYRKRFARHRTNSRDARRATPANNGPSHLRSDLLTHYPDQLDKAFESSTWRVMRHVKSADIRNKYPLPKANPDYHFGLSSHFFTAGSAPKSTFLIHPDWV